MSQIHIVLLVPDGVGWRNFVLGALPKRLREQLGADLQLTLLHALPDSFVRGQPELELFDRLEPFVAARESLQVRVLREAMALGQLYWREQEDAGRLQLSMRRPNSGWKRKALHGAARLVGRLSAAPSRLDRLALRTEIAVRRSAGYDRVRARVQALGPDLVFCTHQRASSAMPWMAAARELGIANATFVFSWDNPAKGRMPVAADHLLVWGPQMLAELELYEPHRDPSSIHSVGTPQFEPLFGAETGSRADFCSEFGFEPDRPILCFSGGDFSSSPRDHDYLADVAIAAREMAEQARPQILFRRSPADTSGRHDQVVAQFPEIVDLPPLWHAPGDGDWQQILPTAADTLLLARIANHCDAVINVGSTMGLDFALVGSPALYLAYEPSGTGGPAAPAGSYGDRWTAHDIYSLPHFRLIKELDPVRWVRSRAQLAHAIECALSGDPQTVESRRLWIERLLEQPVERASVRIAHRLLELATA